jgi:hypothetical protein
MNRHFFVPFLMFFSWVFPHVNTLNIKDFPANLETSLPREAIANESDGRPPSSHGNGRNPCDESGLDLTPIVIDRHNSEIGFSNWGTTKAENPNLWVYIPYEREQLSRATFSIRTGNDDEIVYHDRIPLRTLGTTPNIVKISLEEIDISLEIGQWYRWYLFLNVYCSEEAEQPEQDEISAWIQRQEDVSSDRIYDRLAEVAAIEDPQSRQNAWIEILQELGYNAIADELSTPEN